MKTRTLKNSIPLLGFAMFLLLGCGARKVRKHEEKEEHKTEIKESVKKDSVSETKTEETANIKTLTKSLDFAIKPIGSEPVQFRFLYNGNVVEGSANGEVYFKDKKQEKDSIIKIIEKVRVEVEKQEQKQEYGLPLARTIRHRGTTNLWYKALKNTQTPKLPPQEAYTA